MLSGRGKFFMICLYGEKTESKKRLKLPATICGESSTAGKKVNYNSFQAKWPALNQ